MDTQKSDITHIMIAFFFITVILLIGGMVVGYIMDNEPVIEKCVREGDVNNEYFRKLCDRR